MLRILSRSPRLCHAVLQVTCAAIAGILAIYNLVLLNTSIRVLQGNDFGKFYFGFHAWRAGSSLYAPNSATHLLAGKEYLEFLNMNPPHFHLLLWPVAGLSLTGADYVWTAANLVCALVAVLLVVNELTLTFRFAYVLPILVFILASGATGATFITGQFTGLLLLPLTIAWRALRRGDEIRAGCWLGLLISVKPFLGLFLPVLLLRRQSRAVLAAGVTLVGCFTLGVAVFGVSEHIRWIRALADVHWVWGAMNGSLDAVFVRAFTPTPYGQLTIDAPQIVRPLWLGGAAFVAVETVLVGRRSVDHAFAAVVLGSLLISPLGWVYYLWLAVPGSLALWKNAIPRAARVGLVGSLVPFFVPTLSQFGPLLTLTIGSAYTWTTLALWYGVIAIPGTGIEVVDPLEASPGAHLPATQPAARRAVAEALGPSSR